MIPQNNPHANYLAHKTELDAAINRVLTSGRYILGNETIAFEREFAEYVGTKYAVGVASGTDAICLALLAYGIQPGDRVITVSHTAVATIAAIEMCGAIPALADIDPHSYTIDPDHAKRLLTEKTKAIVPVHLYGQPTDVRPILELAMHHQLFVIEDCAQAHGAIYNGMRVGSWGDAGAFSFYPTKNLGALGDGGAITTNRLEIYEMLLAIRQYGWDNDRLSRMAGRNSRLDELQAAILRVKLKYLDENNRKRIKIASAYNHCLRSLPLTLPTEIPGTTHVYHQYVILCSERVTRDALMEFLHKEDIQSAVHYPVPVHLQPLYLDRFEGAASLPLTERVCGTALSLPMFPELTDADVEIICTTISEFFERKR
jgi:dTDP-4-amino-4,6-dideoxygalactose transaminase